MSEIVLIRPGCTDFDEQSRIQGSIDLPLNPRGKQQVDHLVEELRSIQLDVIYSGSCEPARSTAEAIGEHLGIPVKEETGLCNLNQGLWQGLQVDDVRRKFPKVFKQLQESPETICPPEGETLSEAVQRIRKTLRKPMKRNARIGIVASEPLATLVRCVVFDHKPELPDSICGTAEGGHIEVLTTNGSLSKNHQSAAAKDVPQQKQAAAADLTARGDGSR